MSVNKGKIKSLNQQYQEEFNKMMESKYNIIKEIYGENNTICVFLSPINVLYSNIEETKIRERFARIYNGLVVPGTIPENDVSNIIHLKNPNAILCIYDINYFCELLLSQNIYSIAALYGPRYNNPIYKQCIDSLVSQKLLFTLAYNNTFINKIKEDIKTEYENYLEVNSKLLRIEIYRLYDFLVNYITNKNLSHYIYEIFSKENLEKYLTDERSVDDIVNSLENISSNIYDNDTKYIEKEVSMIISNIITINDIKGEMINE